MQGVVDYLGAQAVAVIERYASAPVLRVVPANTVDDDFVAAAALAANVAAIVTGASDVRIVRS